MDKPHETNAKSPTGTKSPSQLGEDYIRGGDTTLVPDQIKLNRDAAVDPAQLDSSLELEFVSNTGGRNGGIPRGAVKVPRSQRRGLFSRATMLAEIQDPYEYPYRTKWFIVFLVAYAAAAAPMGSAIFFRAS
jgi:hypothetical protein